MRGQSPEQLRTRARRARRIHELHRQGIPVKEIARQVSLDQSRVYQVLRSPEPPEPNRPNPAIGEPEYSAAESEFLAAVARYRQEKGQSFLTTTDHLYVLLRLGYRREA